MHEPKAGAYNAFLHLRLEVRKLDRLLPKSRDLKQKMLVIGLGVKERGSHGGTVIVSLPWVSNCLLHQAGNFYKLN